MSRSLLCISIAFTVAVQLFGQEESKKPELLVVPFSAIEAKAAQRAWATYLKTDAEITNSIGMKMTLIPPGEFMMGSPFREAKRSRIELQHRVRITRPFLIGTYEVTQSEWEGVMGNNPSELSAKGPFSLLVRGLDTSHFPVETVSWNDATKFCQKLSERDGKSYRLPTEAEWEYACRAGTTTAFHFGEALNWDQANVPRNRPAGAETKERDLDRTCRVGSYSANAFGLYDFSGNVAEWCRDFFDTKFYELSKLDDPENQTASKFRVVRGGAWSIDRSLARSSARSLASLDGGGPDIGIRVVCELKE